MSCLTDLLAQLTPEQRQILRQQMAPMVSSANERLTEVQDRVNLLQVQIAGFQSEISQINQRISGLNSMLGQQVDTWWSQTEACAAFIGVKPALETEKARLEARRTRLQMELSSISSSQAELTSIQGQVSGNVTAMLSALEAWS
jgi:chromosome segregation ATPase